MRIARCAVPVVACLAAALAVPTSVVATAATAGAAAVRPHGPIEHVLLALTPQDRGALRALAKGQPAGVSRTRARALAAALPSPARQQSVASTARHLGLHVDRITRTAVAVSGPASLVKQLFGSARAVDPASTMQHPLPSVPAGFRGQVTIAFGGDDHRPALRPSATATGQDFRTAYGVDSSNLDPTVAPPLSSPLRKETIATVQLSDWHPADLTAYANRLASTTGKPWPAPKYTSVVPDPSLAPCVDTLSQPNKCANQTGNQPGDDIEVDLDQEAIYAVAPYANQRAYLTSDDFFGLYTSLGAIGDDASNPAVDRHIVAASISWGFCESSLNNDPQPNSLYAAFEDVMSYDLATGVTVFAASGDNGDYCDPGSGPSTAVQGVSYPASSPQVVAVGGTQHASGHAITDGTPQGWVDGGWHPGADPSAAGASGGGESAVFPRPAYQDGVGLTTTMRTVPDIAALAGPPEFGILSSSAALGGGNQNLPVRGTSVSSPVSASTYAVQLALDNTSWGIGNILPGLYRQQTYTGGTPGYTDVNDNCPTFATTPASCNGWNGADVAHAGYDEVTGLGTPLWKNVLSTALGGDPHLSRGGPAYSKSLTVPVTVHMPSFMSFDHYRIDVDGDHICMTNGGSSTPPTQVTLSDFGAPGSADGVHDLTLVAWNDPPAVADGDNPNIVCHYADSLIDIDTSAPLPTATLAIAKGKKDVTASWTADDFGGSGTNSYVVSVTYPGHTVFSTTTSKKGHTSFAAKPGKVYTMTLKVTDRAGNTATTRAALYDDKSFAKSAGWTRSTARTAFDGTSSTTTRRNAKATVHAVGFDYRLYVTTCASCGKLAVYVNGKKKKVVDTYSASTHDRARFDVFSGVFTQTRTIAVKALGTKNHRSTGTRIILDGLATSG
ncbi:MAG: S53 family peptidase [Frankiales bacterium]|nr:S53 family peptidase [Frankiales bacterium]